MTPPPSEVTHLLLEHTGGDPAAAEKLLPLVYQELRTLAGRLMREERRNHTLEPTALVHEAYIRLVDARAVDWQGRAHFLALAAQAMRRVLVDHARKRGTWKRGGGTRRITLTILDRDLEKPVLDILALDQALEELARLSTRQAEVVKLRFFSGLSCREVGHILSISERTVKDDWAMARAWLLRELDS